MAVSNLEGIFWSVLTVRLVRKDKSGHAINSRVAARWSVLSVNTFSVTTMISTWNFETMMSGPASCMVTGFRERVSSDDVEDAIPQHAKEADRKEDENCFGGSIL